MIQNLGAILPCENRISVNVRASFGIDEPQPGEDCLFLNVWTPANDNKKRPVMFYNHGGGFSTGSGGSAGQDGANLARYFDVVVVETNHRLNIFGYLYHQKTGVNFWRCLRINYLPYNLN